MSFDYFIDDKQVNNAKKNEGGVVGNNFGTINNLSDKLIEQYELRLKEKDIIIEDLIKGR